MRDRLIELIGQIDTKCGEMVSCEDCPAYGKGESCINHYIADHLIANGVTVQEWISVEDRLPDHWDMALVWMGDMKYPFLCQWDEVENVWLCDKWTFSRQVFTHWMPLPQPPKGE